MINKVRTGDQRWVREHNLSVVINYLWEAREPVLISQITGHSGLNKSTVGSLIDQLQSLGFVRENGILGERPGRPGILLEINPHMGCLVNLEINVGFLLAVITNFQAKILWRQRLDFPLEDIGSAQKQQWIITEAIALIKKAIDQVKQNGMRLLGIGIGAPGLVDIQSGALLFAPNLKVHNLPIGEIMRRQYANTPLVVENEANAAALGEQMLGAARGYENFLYLSAGVGLGGGLVIDGKLYRGNDGVGGEVGHMTLEPDGPQCNCGNRGCWETLVGPTAIIQKARRLAAENKAPVLSRICQNKLEHIKIEQVIEAAELGEPAVLQVFGEAGRYLGMGIANLLNAFNPRLVVLGGVLSLAGPFILDSAWEEVKKRSLTAARQHVEILLSAFRSDACVMGTTAIFLREIFNNPLAWYETWLGQSASTIASLEHSI